MMWILIVTLTIHGDIQYHEEPIWTHERCIEKGIHYTNKFPDVVISTSCVQR